MLGYRIYYTMLFLHKYSAVILITKYTSAGAKLWQTRIASPNTARFIATDFNISTQYIYMTGAYYDSAAITSTYVIYKLSDSTGIRTWARQYVPAYSGGAVPAVVREDSLGDVFVAGTEQTTSTTYEMTFLKYNSSGTLQFSTHYDSAGLYSGAVGMGSAPKSGGLFAVTGYSGSTFGTWDIVSMELNPSTGAVSDISRVSNGSGSFASHPVAIAKDGKDDVYVVGATEVAGPNIDIKLIKYDSLFNQVWVKTWGGADSLDDEPAYMVIDNSGNLVITGYTTHANGEVDLLVVKYDKNGNLKWSRTVNNYAVAIPHAKGNSLVADANSNIYAAGQIYNGSNYDMITVAYDTGGNQLWQQTYDAGGGSNDIGQNIALDNVNNIYVSGTSTNTTTKFITMMYSTLPLSSQVFTDGAGNPVYLKGQLIFKIDTSAVLRTAVNNNKINFGSFSTFLQPWAADSLNNMLFLKNCQLARVYTGLKTTYTTSISRMGEPIPIPPLWNTFLLTYGAGNSDTAICNILKRHFPFIKYAELDLVGTLNGVVPDDNLYEGYQSCLHPSPWYQHADINVQQAWAYTTGKPSVRIGIFDVGVLWTDNDFGYNGDTGTSVVKGGYDFYTGTDIFSAPSPDYNDGHGTACAGIIGAIRHNTIGIAGIAGGDSTINPGVSLYGFRIDNEEPYPNGSIIPVHTYLNALVQSCLDVPDSSYGYKLHAINNSWEFGSAATDSGYTVNGNSIQGVIDAIHLANRNKVTLGFSIGNGSSPELPAPSNVDDNWILTVGGTGYNGNYEQYGDTSQGGLYFSPNYGYGLDISAPCTNNLVTSLFTSPGGSIYGSFAPFSGTSAACPQAIGVVALLYSYLNDSIPKYNNLAPEDVEYLIEHSAFNTDTPGYNLLTGWGRLNAGGALYLVDTSQRNMHHYDSDSLAYLTTVTLVDSITTLNVTEAATNISGTLFQANNYAADVYKASCSLSLPLPGTDTIRAYWPRPSSSFLYPLVPASNTLVPHERLSVDTIIHTTATINGYLYHLFNVSTGASVGWLPMDTTQAKTTNFAISVLAGAPIVATWDSIFDTLVNHIAVLEDNGFSIKAYPNAVTDIQKLEVIFDKPGEQASINLYDISGRQIMSIFNGVVNEVEINLQIDLSAIESGTYFYSIRCSGLKAGELKIIKI